MNIKIIFSWLLLTFLITGFFSCSDFSSVIDDELVDNEELIPVSFSVEFDKEVSIFRAGETMNLMYYVYETETGNCYKGLSFNDFNGEINDSIPEGNYVFIFFGYNQKTGLLLDTSHGNNIKNPRMQCPYISIITGNPPSCYNKNYDVFYKKINVSIEKNKSNNNSVTLDRIVGKIEIVLDDIIPSEVTSINIIANIPYLYFYTLNTDFNLGLGSGPENFIITDAQRVASGFSMFFIAFENINEDQSRFPVTIELTARKNLPDGVVDTGQSIVSSKKIENVDVLKNKTVRYTGKLFDNITPPLGEKPSSSFTVSINDEWGEIIDKPF